MQEPAMTTTPAISIHPGRLGSQEPGFRSRCGESIPRKHSSRPASIMPSISASLWMPPTRCRMSSGFIAPSHSAATGRHPAATGQAGQCPDDHRHTEQGEHPVRGQCRRDVLAGQMGDLVAEPEEQGPVGRRGLAPDVGHRPGEHVVDAQPRGRADHIGIEATRGDLTLGEIGIDVFAEHRWCQYERHDPDQQRAIGLAAGHSSLG